MQRCDKWAILQSGPTDTADVDNSQRTGLCRTPQGNNWKVFPAPIITHIKPNASATLARNRRLRKRTSRSTSPPRSRLESRRLTGQGDYEKMERLYGVCHCANRLSVIFIDNNIIQLVRIFAPYGFTAFTHDSSPL